MQLEIKVDKKKMRELDKLLKRFPRALPAVISRALNRTARTARTGTARRIQGELSLKYGEILKQLKIQGASRARWQADIHIRGERIPLAKFKARQLKKGVSYQISPRQGRQTILYDPETEPVFVKILKTGHRGVFKRLGKDRLPIMQLFGPSIPGVLLRAPGMLRDAQRDAQAALWKNIDDQVRVELARRSG